jgi:hypothetical protein
MNTLGIDIQRARDVRLTVSGQYTEQQFAPLDTPGRRTRDRR